MAEFEVVHMNPRRFELRNETEMVGYLDFHEGVGSLHLDYVFVKPEYRGQQVGVEIVKEGIKLAQEKKMIPRPICGYAGAIMKRNNWPEDFKA